MTKIKTQMITAILSLLKLTPSKIINWFKKYNKIIAVIIITILSAIFVILRNLLKLKDAEFARVNNNYLYYELLASLLGNNNRTLLFNIQEYKGTKDSLLQEVQAILKKLKIKDKELKLVLILLTEIKLDTTIIIKEKEFEVEIKPNQLTSIKILKKDSILNTKLDIRNSLTLFIKLKKVYRHLYKNLFCRLLKFDFKKDLTYEYQIHNTNDLIKIENTRLVLISN